MKATEDDYMKRTEVRIERVFEAPVSRVYHAFTDPETMSRWMWAGIGGDVWAQSDLRVGGAYRIYTKEAGGTHQGEGWSGMCGLFVDLVPDRRLVYTLHWDANVFYNVPANLTLDEVVSVNFEPVDEGEGEQTRMTFVHMGIPDDGASAQGHKGGIAASFDILAALL